MNTKKYLANSEEDRKGRTKTRGHKQQKHRKIVEKTQPHQHIY